ncbi:hypothetical protein [Thalassospira sp.]|uniref:hypothetical protein n=1 Tax=Thalassospira sp. TaxID=1912094 RepID=UPI002608076E|nr:hypothetical protein [Thalassospira sp.]
MFAISTNRCHMATVEFFALFSQLLLLARPRQPHTFNNRAHRHEWLTVMLESNKAISVEIQRHQGLTGQVVVFWCMFFHVIKFLSGERLII